MKNEKLKNIDELMKASDVIELLERKQEDAEAMLRTYLRSDGIPRPGYSQMANAAGRNIDSYKVVLRLIESEMENRS